MTQTEVIIDEPTVTEPVIEESVVITNDLDNSTNEISTTQIQPKTVTSRTYTIRQGDSLISICREVYGNDEMMDILMEANNITDPNKIYYGMVIKLPDEN